MVCSRQIQILMVVFLACTAAHVCARERTRGNGKDNNPAASTNVTDALMLAEYDVLFTHNIFSREQPKRKRDAPPLPPPIEKTSEQMQEEKAARDKEAAIRGDAEIVLMGLVIRDEQRFAILEDRRAGKKLTVRPGDVLGSGKAGEVTIDALEFVSAENTSKINIGFNLNGKVAVQRSSESSSGSPAANSGATAGTNPAGAAPGTVGPDGTVLPGTAAPAGAGAGSAVDESNLSTVEKMRRKRQKESNQ